MAKTINHQAKIIHRTKIVLKPRTLKPGSLVEFTYTEGAGKLRPLVLVLANGYYDKKVNSEKTILIHGINFNYLPESVINRLKDKIEKRPILGKQIYFTKQERDEKGRFIIEGNRYTRLELPTLQESTKENAPLSIAQTRIMIQTLYSSVIEKVAKKHNCYRTYDVQEIRNIKGVLYKFD